VTFRCLAVLASLGTFLTGRTATASVHVRGGRMPRHHHGRDSSQSLGADAGRPTAFSYLWCSTTVSADFPPLKNRQIPQSLDEKRCERLRFEDHIISQLRKDTHVCLHSVGCRRSGRAVFFL